MKRLALLLVGLLLCLEPTAGHVQKRPRRHKRHDLEAFSGFYHTNQSLPVHEHDAIDRTGRSDEELALLLQMHANLQLSRFGKVGEDGLKERLRPKRRAVLLKRALEGNRVDNEKRAANASTDGDVSYSSAAAAPLVAAASATSILGQPLAQPSGGLNDAEAYASSQGKVIQQEPNTASTLGIDIFSTGEDSSKNLVAVDYGESGVFKTFHLESDALRKASSLIYPWAARAASSPSR
jgi:hypothetical protein